MTRAAWLAIGVGVFLVVGTANAGGYRFGVSDQAFYVPAISLRADDTLFPRDRGVFEPQMRLWLGDEILGAVVRVSGIDLPALFALLYVLTMIGLAIGAVYLARSLGMDWWTIAVCLILLTLRHRIARTGANSLEGYMHPRMLAFACGLVALACTTRLRHAAAILWTAAAALVHTSTAIWFAGAVATAALWPHLQRPKTRWTIAAMTPVAIAGLVVATRHLPVMDAEWLAVLGDRDYLFSAEWPLYAWISNLAYPAAIIAIYRRRVRIGAAVAGESSLVAGLVALVVTFLVTIPLTEMHIAFFVQAQANRVFWPIGAVATIYVSWWVMADLARRWPVRARQGLVTLLTLLAIGRGIYVLYETRRPLVQFSAATDEWMQAMRWLRTQPASWHVLADPGHAWKYGTSVRVAALRDTPLEAGKDPAMALYDRDLAIRVADRARALSGFDAWTTVEDVRRVSSRYDLDVFVDQTDRSFELPILFRNDTFVVYDLR